MPLVLQRFSGVALVTVAFAFSGCRPLARALLLREQIITSEVSPDERYTATAFQHTWGPPTKYATYVSLRPSRSSFKAKASDYDAVFEIDGPRAVGVVWDSSSQLRIVCVGCTRDATAKQEKSWRDVSVLLECPGAPQ